LIDAFLKKAWQKSHSQINHASGIFLFIVIFLIFVKNITCGGGLRVISRLAPAPGQSST
jgi:hypothetical protein